MLCFLLLAPTPAWSDQVRPAVDAGIRPASGSGSIEFTARLRVDGTAARRNLLLFQVASADGAELYEIHIAAGDLLIVRDHAHCIRSAARTPHNFKTGGTYRLTLKWNGASTRFLVNGKKTDEFNLMLIDAFSRFRDVSTIDGGSDIEVSDIKVAAAAGIAEDPKDRNFVREHRCPEMASLLDSPQQEQFMGVSLHRFTDAKTREQIKRYIALLPAAVTGSIGHVVFVEKSYNPDTAWKGMALLGARTMLVQEVSLGSPSTFFHEAAHLYDYHASVREGNSKSSAWERKFMRTSRQGGVEPRPSQTRGHSVLERMDGSSAEEEIAAFVGIVYGRYFQLEGSSRKNPFVTADDKAKVDFLLEQGFITRAIYDRINR